ncbi:unnamed protein product [Rhodiola kirilowii]
MASRGGGGRRSDQPASASGGRGRGEGRGRGRGRDPGSRPESTPSVGASAPVPSVVAPSRPITQAGASSSTAVSHSSSSVDRPAAQSSVAVGQPSSSSATVSKLSEDVKQQLTIRTPAEVVPPVSSKGVRFAQRPGYGTRGTKCVVRANHFLVEVADKDLHHYDVTITPEVPKSLNRIIISQLVKMYSETNLNRKRLAYDGMKSLYTAGALPFETKEFVVELQEEGKRSANRPKRKFKVEIKFAVKVSIYHLEQFLQRRQPDAPQETIQALDVVLRQLPSNIFTVVGRSFFSTSLGQATKPGDGFEYWKGYYQSIRLTQMGLSLNIDVSARVFYEPICVTDFIAKYCVRDVTKPLSDQDRIKVKKALKGIKVEVTHRDTARSYKITGISNQMSSRLMFTLDDSGTEVSVAQYYSQKYKKLNYPWLPCLQAGNDKKRIDLPMEVCMIVKGQRFSKKLNEKQVTNLLRATCQRPPEREKTIKQMVVQEHFHDDFVKNDFGMRVSDQFTSIEARVLPPPRLQYHGSDCNPQVGQWNMIDKKMINGGTVENWTCVSFSNLREDAAQYFYHQLIDMCCQKGMVFSKSPVIPTSSANPRQIERTLIDIHKQCSTKNKPLQLLLVILPDITGSYGTIKRVCETELGIVSQCCQPRNAQKCAGQYLENVSLKINVKVGGRNTVLVDALSRRIPLVTDAPTIIFGADVTHPAPGEDSSPSIAAVVASMDWPEVTKYRGLISSQSHREEIIQDLYSIVEDPVKGHKHAGMIRDHLMAFRRSTNMIPKRIIFYRDGVSEGQFSQVLLYEMDAIRKACASLQDGYLPPVTFVVVQKRHHTRFFPFDHGNRRMTDRSGNVLPGTVVDRKICHPTEFDFYLNSHAGIQGTSRPTHYHVLFDENKFDADQLQSLTNNLCYTYARCTKSVSIVPPAYYAHLLAFRARYYVEGSDLSDSGSGVGRSTIGAQREVKPLPAILDNVKGVMFYC